MLECAECLLTPLSRLRGRGLAQRHAVCNAGGFGFVSRSMAAAMKAQSRWEAMARAEVFYAGVALLVLGSVLVVSSFLALGFTGTFLGG